MSKPRIRVMQFGDQVLVTRSAYRGIADVWTSPDSFCKTIWPNLIRDHHEKRLKMFGDPSKYEAEKKWILDQVNKQKPSN